MNQPTYSGFERDVFRTVADYFLNLPEPLLTFEYYELFVNILGMYELRNKLSVSYKFISTGRKKKSVSQSGPWPLSLYGNWNLRNIISAVVLYYNINWNAIVSHSMQITVWTNFLNIR